MNMECILEWFMITYILKGNLKLVGKDHSNIDYLYLYGHVSIDSL